MIRLCEAFIYTWEAWGKSPILTPPIELVICIDGTLQTSTILHPHISHIGSGFSPRIGHDRSACQSMENALRHLRGSSPHHRELSFSCRAVPKDYEADFFLTDPHPLPPYRVLQRYHRLHPQPRGIHVLLGRTSHVRGSRRPERHSSRRGHAWQGKRHAKQKREEETGGSQLESVVR